MLIRILSVPFEDCIKNFGGYVFMVFYIVELQNVHAYAPAERIEAKSLTSAMRVASRNKFF